MAIRAELENKAQEKVSGTISAVTYYVDAKTGNDDNDGLTASSPFKTIQHAIDKLPPVLRHGVEINLAEGDYTSEGTIKISGFQGEGTLALSGVSTDKSKVRLKNALLSKNAAYIRLNYITFIGTGNTIHITTSYYVNVSQCTVEGDGTNSGYYIEMGSVANLVNCIAKNCQYAVYARKLGQVSTEILSGTGNVTALHAAYGGVIAKAGGQPTGTTAEQTTYGGVIR